MTSQDQNAEEPLSDTQSQHEQAQSLKKNESPQTECSLGAATGEKRLAHTSKAAQQSWLDATGCVTQKVR